MSLEAKTLFILFFVYQLKHFFADYIFQYNYMLKKNTSWLGLCGATQPALCRSRRDDHDHLSLRKTKHVVAGVVGFCDSFYHRSIAFGATISGAIYRHPSIHLLVDIGV